MRRSSRFMTALTAWSALSQLTATLKPKNNIETCIEVHLPADSIINLSITQSKMPKHILVVTMLLQVCKYCKYVTINIYTFKWLRHGFIWI